MARSFEPVQLGSIEIFCKAAEQESFTRAAELLGLTPPAVSRSIARLEARLGVRLFSRSTRSIRLTGDGELYRAQCQQALEQIANAERLLTGRQQVSAGPIRVSAPTTYAHHRLLPALPAFSLRHPAVRVEVNISNRNVDFIEEGFDVAIRLGEPKDSRLVARRLEDAALGVYAAPDYLARRGPPRTLEALRRHDCIEFILPSTGRPLPWLFRVSGEDREVAVQSSRRVSDDVLGCISWAGAGGGLVQTYDFIAQPMVERGQLIEVLRRFRGRTRPFSILYPHNRLLSARVRAFVDFVIANAAEAAPTAASRS